MDSSRKRGNRAGYLNRASETARRASGTTIQKLGEAADKARSSTSKVAGGAIDLTESLQTSALEAAKRLQSTPAKILDRLSRECSAPAFVLPTGSGADDYQLVFEFDEVIDQLRSGILVRPVIDVWTGRLDLDFTIFPSRLKEAFTTQFTSSRSSIGASQKAAVEHIDSRKQLSGNKLVNPLGQALVL